MRPSQLQFFDDALPNLRRYKFLPEDMGEILLTLTAKSGMIAVQIAASEETRKMIEAGRKELESALKKARVSLAEIKIIRTEEAGQNA